MRQSTIRRLTTAAHRDFFGINDITSKDVAGAFSSGTKLSTDNIEKKYSPLMQARGRLLNEERDKDLTFGRVRRDADNQILNHGQYDPDSPELRYTTIEVKQMFVADNATERPKAEVVVDPAPDKSSVPNFQQPYKISEVKPALEFSTVMQIFRRLDDESVLKYKNMPPLSFYFAAASQSQLEETDQTDVSNNQSSKVTTATRHSSGDEQTNSDKEAPNYELRRPQMDLDAQAGPEGARAPVHELNRLSLEYAERAGELQQSDTKFDRSIDRRFDVEDEPVKATRAIDHIKMIRAGKVEPVSRKLKETIGSHPNPYPLRSSIKLDSHGYNDYTYQVPNWTQVRKAEVIAYLRGSIIYNNYDILAINKPYGINSHKNKKSLKQEYDMDSLVSEIAKSMNIEKVFLAHRLDKTTSGILLFATSQERANNLNKLFKADEIAKTYVCITRGVPDPSHGIIDMPIGEIEVAGKLRSCPAPYNLEEKRQLSKKYREAKRAITEYRVIHSKRRVALVELKPKTGVKHQLRCHLSFGLNTPILGDHKYSHLHKLAPQKLDISLLKALHLRQAKVRTLPVHLHAKSIVIPNAKANGETLFINAPLPKHFIDNMKKLKLSFDEK